MTDTSTEVLLERIAGQVNLISEAMKRTEIEVNTIRQAQTAQGEKLATIAALNIQERFVSLNAELKAERARIDVLEDDKIARKSAMATVRVVWTIMGALATVAVAVIGKLIGV